MFIYRNCQKLAWYMMRWKRLINKSNLTNLSKILVFVFITSLPFISITNTVGMDIFLDSFENPEHYVLLKNRDGISAAEITEPSYIIIQRADHPDFEIKKKDEIMYSTLSGEIICNKVKEIQTIGCIKKIKIDNNEDTNLKEIVYNNQVIGKVIKIVDENPWNSISLKVWSISIENLNIRSIFS